MRDIKLLGIDLAKMVFQLHGTDRHNKVVLRKRLRRAELLAFMGQLPACRVVMEACGSAHYWARQFQALGHRVQLIAPQHVKPYVRGNKNDRHDARAICAAAQEPTMIYVAIKSIEQQDIQALHRIREAAQKQRVATGNQIRGLLAEYGVVFPQGINQVRQHVVALLGQSESGLSEFFQALLADLYEQFCQLDRRVKAYDHRIQRWAKQHRLCQELMRQRGVGPLTASAYMASVGDPRVFKNGRHAAAWLGLTPKHKGSGDHMRLLSISKRGDRYLRTLLIHGARAVVRYAKNKDDALSQWINRIHRQRGANVATVALANKNARVLWAKMAAAV